MGDTLKTLGSWTPILSLLVSVVSVMLVLYQIQNLVKSIHSQTYQRIYELMIQIDRFFIDNPKLKPYFYPNTSITLENVEKEKLLSVSEMMMDYFDNVYHQRACMPSHTFDGFREYMQSVFRSSEILRDYLALSGREQWYPEDFLACMKGALKDGDKQR
jgi:hypothetical protein